MKKTHSSYKSVLITVAILLICHAEDATSQNNLFQVEGILLDSTDLTPIEMAVVSIANLDIWSITDKEGRFSFDHVPQGTHIFNFRLLGYQELNIPRMVRSDIDNWQQKLQQASSMMDTTVYTYNMPGNNQVLIKKGLEYVIEIGQIKSIRTSFVIDGAWLFQESYNNSPSNVKRSRVEQGKLVFIIYCV